MKAIDCASILNGRRMLYGYHIDAEWENENRESLILQSIAWVNPKKDIAGQLYWLVSCSNSTGDSFVSDYRSEIIHADIFDDREEAIKLVVMLENIATETSRKLHYTMPNNGWVAYYNDQQPRMLDLSHLDGIFDRLDGVFLIQISDKQVKRWTYEE